MGHKRAVSDLSWADILTAVRYRPREMVNKEDIVLLEENLPGGKKKNLVFVSPAWQSFFPWSPRSGSGSHPILPLTLAGT